MPDLDHARMMLTLAQRDLRALQGMLDIDIFAGEIFGFHAQQAVEKALKAWLTLLDVAYPLIHVLHELFVLLEAHGATTAAAFRHLEDLTPFAVQFRYAEFTIVDANLDRSEVIRQVGDLIAHIEVRIREMEAAG